MSQPQLHLQWIHSQYRTSECWRLGLSSIGKSNKSNIFCRGYTAIVTMSYQQMNVLIHPYLKRITLYHTCCWLTGAFWRNSELSIFVVVIVAADLHCRTMKQNVTHRPEGWGLLERTYTFLWMTESDAICVHRLQNMYALSVKHYFAGHNFYLYTVSTGGQDSPVGVATRYRPDGLGTESQWGVRHFHARPDRPRGPPSLLHNTMCTGSLPGSKAAGVWC
jgi:hypothetical protein